MLNNNVILPVTLKETNLIDLCGTTTETSRESQLNFGTHFCLEQELSCLVPFTYTVLAFCVTNLTVGVQRKKTYNDQNLL